MNVEWIVSSSGLIVLVLLIRFLFKKKISPCLRYALWLLVAFRLLFPLSVSGTALSILNLLPRQDIAEEGVGNNTGQVIYEQGSEPSGVVAEFDITPEPLEDPIIERKAEAGNQNVKSIPSREGTGLLARGGKADVGKALRFCHLLGAGICGGIFFAVHLDYVRKLRRSRRWMEPETLPVLSVIPVYRSKVIKTPCLFGLFFPAVYVREDVVKKKKIFQFVLCHENMHYRQHDHWWALVRILCLCLHWFNPLVWVAATVSRRDGEMACDERTVWMLGDKARVDYGKALLELSMEKGSCLNDWRVSAKMSGGGRQMKERLWMIVNMPVRTIGRRIFVLALAMLLFIIAFTGKSRDREKEAAKTEEPVEDVRPDLGIEEESRTEKSAEIEFYREIVPVTMGEKEYELWCEGHETEYGFYGIDTINLVDPEKPDEYVDSIVTEEISRAYWNVPEGQEPMAVESMYRDGGILTVDLNFDGWNDLCFQGWQTNANIPYYCMLWNPEKGRYEYSVKLCNVEVNEKEQWIIEGTRDGGGQYSTTYYRYDEEDQLHMVKYVEENLSPDALFGHMELVYVEDEESVYVLPAIADGRELPGTLIAMAKQSLTELYQWTGEKVDTACFQVTDMGGVFFGMTPEDMRHSRTFYTKHFGADTNYNLSNYEKSISSMYLTSGRSVWYSPVFWNVFPDEMDGMTEEEIIIWYFERGFLADDCKVESIEKRYEDIWTIRTQSGVWFEVVYDVSLGEVTMVTGPYFDYPVH